MHGSPRQYWSRYDRSVVRTLAAALRSSPVEAWCIFDNTASGAALENPWEVEAELAEAVSPIAAPWVAPLVAGGGLVSCRHAPRRPAWSVQLRNGRGCGNVSSE